MVCACANPITVICPIMPTVTEMEVAHIGSVTNSVDKILAFYVIKIRHSKLATEKKMRHLSYYGRLENIFANC